MCNVNGLFSEFLGACVSTFHPQPPGRASMPGSLRRYSSVNPKVTATLPHPTEDLRISQQGTAFSHRRGIKTCLLLDTEKGISKISSLFPTPQITREWRRAQKEVELYKISHMNSRRKGHGMSPSTF